MTVTESAPPETEAPAPERVGPLGPPGLAGVLGTGDHKVIGRAFIGFSLLFGLTAVVLGALVGLERMDASEAEIVGSDAFFQVFTLYRVTALFLFAVPLLLGLAIHVVPLQVGARTLAFPRAAAASLWTWLIASALVLTAYGINGGPGGGRDDGIDLWILAMVVVVAALLAATVCVLTTVMGLRTPGMTLDRVPMFTWSMFAAGGVWLLTLPVLIAVLLLMWVDHQYGQVLFGLPETMYDQVAWSFGQPQLYAFAVPVLGIVSDIIPVAAGKRARFPLAGAVAIGAFAALGYGSWAMRWLAGVTDEPVFIAMGLLAPLPLLALAGGWVDTLLSGRPRPSPALVLGLVAWLALLGATLSGAAAVIEPLHLLGTSFEQGTFNLAWVSMVLGGAAGMHWWAPKLWGRELGSLTGSLLALLGLGGAVVLAVPELVTGVLDQPLFPTGFEPRDGVELLNTVSMVGAFLVALAMLTLVLEWAGASLGRGPDAEDDPRGGHTLEWATASPPGHGNFDEVPLVTSGSPLLDPAEASEADEGSDG